MRQVRLLFVEDSCECAHAPSSELRMVSSEQKLDEPLGCVESAPEIILLPVGAGEERAEMVQSDTAQLFLDAVAEEARILGLMRQSDKALSPPSLPWSSGYKSLSQ